MKLEGFWYKRVYVKKKPAYITNRRVDAFSCLLKLNAYTSMQLQDNKSAFINTVLATIQK